MMIIGDEYIIIGSANINQKSMDGARDSKIAIGAFQPNHLASTIPARAQMYAFRLALWYEHLKIVEKNWEFYLSDTCYQDLPGHLLHYPIEVSKNRALTTLPGFEYFPDTKARVFSTKSNACFRAFVVVVMEKIHRKCKALFRSRGCLRCCSQPRLLIPVDEPSNGLRIQGQSVRKNSISEDFWSTSTIEMENNAIQFQKSISSISTSNPLDSHGLLLWNQTRNLWLANKQPQRQTQLREPRISWNATYESLLGTNKPFRQPIPLPEMIDFLVDIWEQDVIKT
ncbi:hypothetical protein DVH24_021097 [Malus domestica]|uniref:PLD phosphodiesterase domain-containing protein n=1 Tax=Malus domestica TaxID=3750 RepID=A0A498JDF6_MALDO|nr:hypothetical protein DVH24_021097 [Malus domestica]